MKLRTLLGTFALLACLSPISKADILFEIVSGRGNVPGSPDPQFFNPGSANDSFARSLNATFGVAVANANLNSTLSDAATASPSIGPYTLGAGVGHANIGTSTENYGFTSTLNAIGASFASAITDNSFITWSFTNTGPVDLNSASIAYTRRGDNFTGNTGNVRLQLAINGGGFVDLLNQGGGDDLAVATSQVSQYTTGDGSNPPGANQTDINSFDLNAFDNVTSGTFRLITFNNFGSQISADQSAFLMVNSVGTGNNASFQLNGVTAIPEPSSLALLAFAGLGAAGVVYRRRRKVA